MSAIRLAFTNMYPVSRFYYIQPPARAIGLLERTQQGSRRTAAQSGTSDPQHASIPTQAGGKMLDNGGL